MAKEPKFTDYEVEEFRRSILPMDTCSPDSVIRDALSTKATTDDASALSLSDQVDLLVDHMRASLVAHVAKNGSDQWPASIPRTRKGFSQEAKTLAAEVLRASGWNISKDGCAAFPKES